jgi:hypothetical protein
MTSPAPARWLARDDAACIAMLLLVPALLLAPSLFAGRVLLPADLMLLTGPWRASGALRYPSFHYAHNGMLDPLHQHYPWKVYLSRSFRQGRIPLWNPYEFSGQPFAATGQPAVFYPPNALFALIDPARAFGYVAWFHLALAGLGLFVLARDTGVRPAAALAGAAAFQLTGIFVVTLEFTSYVATMAWLPLVVLGLRRAMLSRGSRWMALAGLPVGLQLLAGHMQFAVYSMVAALACVVFHARADAGGGGELVRRLLRAAVPLALGVGIAALHWLPCLEMGLLSARRGVGSYAGALTQAMPARQLLALIIPDPLGNPVDCGDIFRFIENYPYLGIGPLFLLPAAVLGARRREGWLYAGLFVAGLLLAFGTHLNWLLFRFVPGFAQLTGLGRAIFISAFGGAMGAALGVETIMCRAEEAASTWPRRYAKAMAAPAIAGAVALAAFGLLTLQSPRVSETIAPFYQKVMRLGLAPADVLAQGRVDARVVTPFAVDAFLAHLGRRSVAYLAIVTALMAATVALCGEGARRRVAGWAFAAIVAADLFGYGYRFNPQVPHGMLTLASPAIDAMVVGPRSSRMTSVTPDGNPLHRLPPNLGMVYGLEDINGSDSLASKAYVKVLTSITDSQRPGLPEPDLSSPVVDLLGVTHVATSRDLSAVAGMRRVVDAPFAVYVNDDAFPRAWVATGATAVSSYDEALAKVTSGDVNPRVDVVRVAGSSGTPPDIPGEVREVRREPQHVMLSGSFPGGSQGSWVVMADAYYPGWRAWVDGRPAPVERVDYILRGVPVERPATRIDTVYAPASFRLGQFVSVVSLAVLVGAVACPGRRRRGDE